MRVAIVNDMPMAVEALRRCVLAEPGFEVAWIAQNGQEAVTMCAKSRPDLVLMDLFMPVMNGIDAIRLIMRDSPCAVLVITASVKDATQDVFAALGAGALDVLDTPTLEGRALSDGASRLGAKLRAMRVLVDAASGPVTSPGALTTPPGQSTRGEDTLLALGASTGGPAALSDLLKGLRERLAATSMAAPAIVVIQHIEESFAEGLAQWLARDSGWPVELGHDGRVPTPGLVLMAPAAGHLVLSPRGHLVNRPEPRDYPYRPSVDEFYYSCRHWHGHGMAALLTGMGSDGAKGLLTLHARGWLTMAQEPSSCAVGGMPAAAIKLNATSFVGTPRQIATATFNALTRSVSP